MVQRKLGEDDREITLLEIEMKNLNKNIRYDEWLSGIIGKETYRIIVDEKFLNDKSADAVEKLKSKPVFIYSKVTVDFIDGVEFLEKLGFNLVDTNVSFEKTLSADKKKSVGIELRFARPEDESETVKLAKDNFVYTRFHQDKNISREMADNIKAEWVRNYFLGKRGSEMVLALIYGSIKGFLQLLRDDSGNMIIDQIAVDKDSRKLGVASSMIKFAEIKCDGIDRIQVGTQIANVPSIRMYEKLGFRCFKAEYVFHYHS